MKRRPINKLSIWDGPADTAGPFTLTVVELKIILYALENIQPFDWYNGDSPEELTDAEGATLDGLIGKVMVLADG